MKILWRIELLGGLQALRENRVLNRFSTHKIGALLAYLAYHRGQSLPRGVLIELLWQDKETAQGSQSLRHALSSLRRQLELPGIPAGAVIEADHFNVRLNPETVTTDVEDFHAAIQTATQSRSSSERILHFTRAVELYRGELLPGYYESWILPEQLKLEEQYFQAVESLLRLLEEAGDLQRALAVAHRAVQTDPLREEIHLALMRLYVATGQPQEALHRFTELEHLLRNKLGVEPSLEASDLASLIRAGSLRVRRQERVQPPVAESIPHPSKKRVGSLPSLPGGVLTFVAMELPDIPETTALQLAWQRAQGVLRELIHRHKGQETPLTGDSVSAAFPGPYAALQYLLDSMQVLTPDGLLDYIRTALYTGEVNENETLIPYLYGILSAVYGGQVLCSESTAVLLRPHMKAGIQLQELGNYRMPGYSTHERLFQLCLPGSTRTIFPPLPAEPVTQDNLPVQVTRFFGREEETEQLTALLTSSRLITLTGAGGSGKTRLATEVGKRLLSRFEGGVWIVLFQDLQDPSQMAELIRDSLGLPSSPKVNPLDQVIHFAGQKPALLLLDNMEHLLPEGASLVETLVKRAATLTCLVTSRQPLSLRGEREFPVLPLPVPDCGFRVSDFGLQKAEQGREAVAHLQQFAGVQLFIDRAQAKVPDFQLTPGNAVAIAELCAGLEGIPLAIELAAARVRTISPAQMLRRLSRRFEWLATTRDDVPLRHRSLQAALDWSYQSLPFELQRFLSHLSVFRGGWTQKAAGEVCGELLTPDYLERLQDASLIFVVPWQEEPRFRMLETIREYAAEQLSEEEALLYSSHHADYYSRLASEANSHLDGPESVEWLQTLEEEHDNLRAALQWYAGAGAGEVGLQLAGDLVPFWSRRGHALEGMNWLERFLTAGEMDTQLQAKGLLQYSRLGLTMSNDKSVKDAVETSLQLYRQLNDKKGIAACLYLLGQWYRGYGDLEAEQALYEEGLSLLPEIEDERLHSRFLVALAWHAMAQGDYRGAVDYGNQALLISQQIGDQDAESACLNLLGVALTQRDDLEGARDCCEKAVALSEKVGNQQGLIYALTNLGSAYYYLGENENALRMHERCLAMERAAGDRGGIAISLHNMAMVACTLGDTQKAETFYQEALHINRELGRRNMERHNLIGLGETAYLQEDYPKAQSFYEQGLALSKETGHKGCIANSLNGLGKTACRAGDYLAAKAWLSELLLCCRDIDEPLMIAQTIRNFAELALTQGDPHRAAILSGAAEAVIRSSGGTMAANEQADHEHFFAALRQVLDEASFEEAFNAGLALTLDEATELALSG